MPVEQGLPALPPDVVSQLAQNQARELQLRAEELQLKKQQDQNSFEYAQQALGVQSADRRESREVYKQTRRDTFVFITVLSVIGIGAIVTFLAMGYDAIAMEIIKGAVLLAGGATGGYFYGKSKVSAPSSETRG